MTFMLSILGGYFITLIIVFIHDEISYLKLCRRIIGCKEISLYEIWKIKNNIR